MLLLDTKLHTIPTWEQENLEQSYLLLSPLSLPVISKHLSEQFFHIHTPKTLSKATQDQIFFQTQVLPPALDFIWSQLLFRRPVIVCGWNADIVAGTTLAALAKFFIDDGSIIMDHRLHVPTKASIQRRLQWIVADLPRINPPRWILRRVNEFLLTSNELRRKARTTVGHDGSELTRDEKS